MASPARARTLGIELRKLRNERHLKLDELAQQVGVSTATLSRTETGTRTPSEANVDALLTALDVCDEERERLLDLCREDSQPGWLEVRSPGLPRQLIGLIQLEHEARAIWEVCSVLIPGLLQIKDYSRAIMEGGGVPATEAETRVVTRQGRQSILTQENPPKLHVIIDEAAFLRPVGGTVTMAKQLRHINKVGQLDNVSIQVIPFSAGSHHGLNGPFTVLEFELAPTIVHLEHRCSGLFLDEQEDVTPYVESTQELREIALSHEESLLVIDQHASKLEAES